MATSPNMLLTIPAVGVTPGPEYASQVNVSLLSIDSHDHSAGRGVQITPDGLNISSALDMQNNTLLNTGAVVLSPVLSFNSNSSVYSIGAELYYRDGLGNEVQITQGGSVNAGAGTITGLPSGTASASFSAVAEKFTFQSSTGVGAFIDASSYIMRNHTAGSFGLTIQAPAAMSADYTVTMPALPVSKKILTMTSTGAIAADYDVDNTTIEISSNNLRVKDSGITTAKLANLSVSTAKLADEAVQEAKLGFESVTLPRMAPTRYTTSTYPAQSFTNVTTAVHSMDVTMPVSPSIRPMEIIIETASNNPWTSPAVTRTSAVAGSFRVTLDGVTIANYPLSTDGVINIGVKFFYTGLNSGTKALALVVDTGPGNTSIFTAGRLTAIQY